MTGKTSLVAAGFGCALAVGYALYTPSESTNESPPTAGLAARSLTYAAMPPAESSHGRRPGCEFGRGDAVSLAVIIDTQAQIRPSVLGLSEANSAVDMSSHTRFNLDAKALAVTEDHGAIVLAKFRDIQSDSLDQLDALGHPFLVLIERDCGISKFARLDVAPLAAARSQQALVHELHFKWHDDASPVESAGHNGIGSYLARFGVGEDSGGAFVQRRIVRYDEMWDADSAQSPRFGEFPEQSLLTVRVGPGPWFASMMGNEQLVGEGSQSTSRVSASTVDTPEGAFNGIPHDQARYVWEDLLPRQLLVRARRPVTDMDRRRYAAVAHLSLEESVDAYVERVAARVGFQDTWPALTDYLEARPEAATPLIHKLQDGQIPGEATAGIYVALGRARTAEARTVLLAVARDQGAPSFERARAMFALVDRDDVDAEVAEFLHSQTQSMSAAMGREAALALGALDGLQANPEIHHVAVDAADRILAQGRDDARALRPAFGLIGNMGDSSMLPRLEPYTRHPDPDVREAGGSRHSPHAPR